MNAYCFIITGVLMTAVMDKKTEKVISRVRKLSELLNVRPEDVPKVLKKMKSEAAN